MQRHSDQCYPDQRRTKVDKEQTLGRLFPLIRIAADGVMLIRSISDVLVKYNHSFAGTSGQHSLHIVAFVYVFRH